MATTGRTVKAKHMHHYPIFLLLLGGGLIFWWLLGSCLQIQTSEAFILRGTTVQFHPNLAILRQPFDLLGGQLSPDDAKAAMWGWGIEFIYLVLVLGVEVLYVHLKKINRWVAIAFLICAFGIVGFDFYTDFSYGTLASGPGGQFGFAAVTSIIVAFFGIGGLILIEYALKDMAS